MVRRFLFALAALSLPMAGAATGVVQTVQPASAASAPWHFPNPAIAVDNAGNQYVFWQGTNGGLWEAYNNGSWHGPIGFRAGTLGSTPTVAVSNTRYAYSGSHIYYDQYVVWKGTDNRLWFLYWNGKWNGPYSLGMGPLGSRPSISTDDAGVLTAVWRGTDNALWYAYSTTNPSASGWSGPHRAGDGPLGSMPSATGPVGGGYVDAGWTGTGPGFDLWYHAEDGTLHNVGMGPLDSPPSLVSVPGGSYRVGFWAGTDSALWSGEWRYIATTHTLSTSGPGRIGLGPLGSAPMAAFEYNTYYVVWQGTDRNLWEGTCNVVGTCWALNKVAGMGPL
jgi:hypothetical protein